MRTGFLTAIVLGSLAAPTLAQVRAPSMNDEDLPQDHVPDGAPAADPRAARREPEAPSARRAAAPDSAVAGNGVPDRSAPENPAAGGPALPSAPPGSAAVTPPDELARLQRHIEPVQTTYGEILELWHARRAAVREQNRPKARSARERIIAAMRELGIENLSAFAAAEVRDVERSLAARLPEDAVEHASFAVELAPALADSHLALARALFAREPTRPVAVLPEVEAALAAAGHEPHTLHALYGDACGAGLAALFGASALSLLILFARRVRLFLHDFCHLPLLRAGAPAQAGVLALVLVALPLGFRLGPFAVLAAVTLAAWLYLSRSERAVATTALLALVALPHLAGAAARLTSWNGTLAQEVFELEHGGPAGPSSAEALARAAREALPAPALMALGHHAKRRGNLDAALRLYERAAASDSRGEIRVNTGNVLFLKGDLEGAKAAYLAAIDRAGSNVMLAAAHYNLSKLYLRLSALEQSEEARKKAQQEDPIFIERYGSNDDFRANRYLVDVPVPADRIEALAGSPAARDISEVVRARVAGAIPAPFWPAGPLAFVAALWALAFLTRSAQLAHACDRCGRPACRRCDGISNALCGQCVKVFVRRGIVDARDRVRKEQGVRRHAQWVRFTTRTLAVLGGGAGHLYAGEAVRGFLFLFGVLFMVFVIWFSRGLVPSPLPSPYAAAGKLLVAVPLGAGLYAVAVRAAFRRSKG